MSGKAVPDEPEARASADYFRKLHQQLVQKDNIIKLLQLQVKNLEGKGGEGEAIERLTQALADAEARVAELEAGAGGDGADAEALARRVAELEEELEAARRTEQDKRRLEAQLSLREEELGRMRESLREVERGLGADKELEDQLTVARATIESLERELAKARDRAAKPAAKAPPESVARLTEQVADLEAALEVARQTIEALEKRPPTGRANGGQALLPLATRGAAEAGPGGDAFALRQAAIEGIQALEDHRAGLTTPGECLDILGPLLEGLTASLGLERIATVGERFDPARHVLGRVHYADGQGHDVVLAEELAGWSADGRVLKPAQVSVVRDPSFCERCKVSCIPGAAFCHQCGTRMQRPPAEATGPLPRARSPREELRRQLDAGRAGLAKGDLKTAREAFGAVLAREPGEPRALLGLTECDEIEGALKPALDRLAALSAELARQPELARARQRVAAKLEIVERLKTVR